MSTNIFCFVIYSEADIAVYIVEALGCDHVAFHQVECKLTVLQVATVQNLLGCQVQGGTCGIVDIVECNSILYCFIDCTAELVGMDIGDKELSNLHFFTVDILQICIVLIVANHNMQFPSRCVQLNTGSDVVGISRILEDPVVVFASLVKGKFLEIDGASLVRYTGGDFLVGNIHYQELVASLYILRKLLHRRLHILGCANLQVQILSNRRCHIVVDEFYTAQFCGAGITLCIQFKMLYFCMQLALQIIGNGDLHLNIIIHDIATSLLAVGNCLADNIGISTCLVKGQRCKSSRTVCIVLCRLISLYLFYYVTYPV